MNFLYHYATSKSWTRLHSPFLFALFIEIHRHPSQSVNIFDIIERKRKQLLSNEQTISTTDLGAGSKTLSTGQKNKTISSIARTSLSQAWQGRFMACLAKTTSAKTILELGTSLGISAAYMASLLPESKVYTIEGDPAVAEIAGHVFNDLHFKNILLINSSFENFLTQNQMSLPKVDLIFIDGNHRSEALITYMDALWKYCHEHTIVVIDDIYWSRDMRAGWHEIINRTEVTQSVDCYLFGILFFRKDFLQKTHHKVRYPIHALFA